MVMKNKLITVRQKTKDSLDLLKSYPRETYDDTISELIKQTKPNQTNNETKPILQD